MARSFLKLKRAAPYRPSYTCPEINAAQVQCTDLVRSLTELHKTLSEFSNKMYGPLEELRTANENLRTWGQYWKDTAEKLSDDMDKINPPPTPKKREAKRTPKRRRK
jgi:hypothetical protein